MSDDPFLLDDGLTAEQASLFVRRSALIALHNLAPGFIELAAMQAARGNPARAEHFLGLARDPAAEPATPLVSLSELEAVTIDEAIALAHERFRTATARLGLGVIPVDVFAQEAADDH